MYTQGLDQKGQAPEKRDSLESAADLEAFQKRVDAEEKNRGQRTGCRRLIVAL